MSKGCSSDQKCHENLVSGYPVIRDVTLYKKKLPENPPPGELFAMIACTSDVYEVVEGVYQGLNTPEEPTYYRILNKICFNCIQLRVNDLVIGQRGKRIEKVEACEGDLYIDTTTNRVWKFHHCRWVDTEYLIGDPSNLPSCTEIDPNDANFVLIHGDHSCQISLQQLRDLIFGNPSQMTFTESGSMVVGPFWRNVRIDGIAGGGGGGGGGGGNLFGGGGGGGGLPGATGSAELSVNPGDTIAWTIGAGGAGGAGGAAGGGAGQNGGAGSNTIISINGNPVLTLVGGAPGSGGTGGTQNAPGTGGAPNGNNGSGQLGGLGGAPNGGDGGAANAAGFNGTPGATGSATIIFSLDRPVYPKELVGFNASQIVQTVATPVTIWPLMSSYAGNPPFLTSGVTAANWDGTLLQITTDPSVFGATTVTGATVSYTSTAAGNPGVNYPLAFTLTPNVLEGRLPDNGLGLGAISVAYN